MNYKFANFLGVPYRGGNVVFAGDQLLAPASNRVREIALSDASSSTYPFENQHQVQVTALSPDGGLLLTIDTSGRLLLALRCKKVLLHRMRLKSPSQVAAFSPDGSLISIAVGKVLQVRLESQISGEDSIVSVRHTCQGQCRDTSFIKDAYAQFFLASECCSRAAM